jgi:hypothetical protein
MTKTIGTNRAGHERLEKRNEGQTTLGIITFIFPVLFQ